MPFFQTGLQCVHCKAVLTYEDKDTYWNNVGKPQPHRKKGGPELVCDSKEFLTVAINTQSGALIGPDPLAIVPTTPVNQYAMETETHAAKLVEPLPMRLICPSCCTLHEDQGEYATKPHHTHACQYCGMVWRPAIVPTVGVKFLPGFKDR